MRRMAQHAPSEDPEPSTARDLVHFPLRELAAVDQMREMIAHLGDDLHGLPKSLSCIGVARRGLAPGFRVVAVERHEGVLEQIVIEETLRPRAALGRFVEGQLVGHAATNRSAKASSSSCSAALARAAACAARAIAADRSAAARMVCSPTRAASA